MSDLLIKLIIWKGKDKEEEEEEEEDDDDNNNNNNILLYIVANTYIFLFTFLGMIFFSEISYIFIEQYFMFILWDAMIYVFVTCDIFEKLYSHGLCLSRKLL